MKKFIILTVALILLLSACTSPADDHSSESPETTVASLPVTSTNTTTPASQPPELSQEELELAMKEAYAKEHGYAVEELRIDYYGCYGENHVCFTYGPFGFEDVICEEYLMGRWFVYGSSQCMDVYRNGQMLKLAEAVESGWFTQDELDQLYGCYRLRWPIYYSPAESEEVIKAEIREVYAQQSMAAGDVEQATADDIFVDAYLGCFGENHVVFISASWHNFLQAEWSETLMGLEFYYADGQGLSVYRDGQVRSLRQAVENGWFTQDELGQLRAVYRTAYPYDGD